MSYRKLTWILFGLYTVYYLFLCFVLPTPRIVNGLLDDSFYYLQVARNMARGLGSSFDGLEPTNGYHPLWMLLLVPGQMIAGRQAETGLALSLALSAALGLGSVLLMRRTLIRGCDGWTAAVGMLLFAWPRFFGQTINLLESALLLFLYLLTIAAILDSGMASGSRKGIFGILLGLAALARLDTVFLWIAVACLGLLRAGQGQSLFGAGGEWPPDEGRFRRSASTWRKEMSPGLFLSQAWSNLWPLVVSLVVVSPYLVWNRSTFGHFQPISGAIKSTFPYPHPHLEYLRQFPEFTLLLVIGAGFFLASLERGASRFVRIVGLFGLGGLLHMAYTVLFMGWGVDRWHFGILIPIGLLGIPWLLYRILDLMAIGRSPGLLLVIFVLAFAGAIGAQYLSLRARSERHLHAAREVALWAKAYLPPESVFGVADAGVFAYFSDRTTVNLDGLINNYRFLDVLRDGRIRDYLEEKGVGYIFDAYVYGHPEWLDGRYDSRRMRFWYRPGNRPAGEITLYREDEVHRVNLLARWTAAKTPEPGALILYRYRPERQDSASFRR